MEVAPALTTVRKAAPRLALEGVRQSWLPPLALGLLAASLRFYHLGFRSLWSDEVLAANSVRYATPGQVIGWTHITLDQMPLLNLVLWLMRGLGGSEWVVRLPAALAGTGTVVLLYLLGRMLWRPRVGLLAALLMAVLPFGVYWGQEARPYSLLMLLTTAQMLFAYRGMVGSRLSDWAAFAAVTILDIYTHYVGLIALAGASAFIGFVLIVETAAYLTAARSEKIPGRGRVSIVSPSFRPIMRRVALAAGAAIGVFIAYLPWLPWLRVFLSRSDLNSGHTLASHSLTLEGVRAFLALFGFSGFLLALLLLGFISAGLYLCTDRWRSGALVLCWLGVPVLGFWAHVGTGITWLDPRDLSFLFPGAVLAAALGADVVAEGAGRFLRRWARQGSAAATVYALVALLLLQTAVPSLAQSYTNLTDDYRGMADWITVHSGSSATVLGMGGCSGLITMSLSYYLWLRHSPVLVVDATQFNDQVVAQIRHRTGPVWAAVFGSCPTENFLSLPRRGLEVKGFVDLVLFRVKARNLGPLAQVETLMRWGSTTYPVLGSSLELLRVISGRARLGSSLLPRPDGRGWAFSPGGTVSSDHQAFQLAPTDSMVNVTASVPSRSARTYIISFRYRNEALNGDQRVFVSAHSSAGAWLAIFPNGAGYACQPTGKWIEGSFAFSTPAHTDTLTIWLRATGTGSSKFAAVTLRQVA